MCWPKLLNDSSDPTNYFKNHRVLITNQKHNKQLNKPDFQSPISNIWAHYHNILFLLKILVFVFKVD